MRFEGVVAERVRLKLYPGFRYGSVVGPRDERDADIPIRLVRSS